MKNSIKRAQSQACLGFAERKNFRPLAKQLKKLSLTLALLITAATGAWADDTEPAVTIDNTKVTASFTMPASDVTVNYTLVRDMNDTENPVAFSGLPPPAHRSAYRLSSARQRESGLLTACNPKAREHGTTSTAAA